MHLPGFCAHFVASFVCAHPICLHPSTIAHSKWRRSSFSLEKSFPFLGNFNNKSKGCRFFIVGADKAGCFQVFLAHLSLVVRRSASGPLCVGPSRFGKQNRAHESTVGLMICQNEGGASRGLAHVDCALCCCFCLLQLLLASLRQFGSC